MSEKDVAMDTDQRFSLSLPLSTKYQTIRTFRVDKRLQEAIHLFQSKVYKGCGKRPSLSLQVRLGLSILHSLPIDFQELSEIPTENLEYFLKDRALTLLREINGQDS
ncbi:MAG: hypothetical protein HYU64_07965 [Armatimonadetes bacterium]|nr:hypothetical protein [Armatimonadota bacterium]